LPYLPPQPIPPHAPKGCLFLAEWGKARSDAPGSNLIKKSNSFINMAAEIDGRDGKGGMVHGIRSLGSAALDFVYVATGAADIFWEGGCWEWVRLELSRIDEYMLC
jgi:myo-inositol-1(or 4)-monophosphatase